MGRRVEFAGCTAAPGTPTIKISLAAVLESNTIVAVCSTCSPGPTEMRDGCPIICVFALRRAWVSPWPVDANSSSSGGGGEGGGGILHRSPQSKQSLANRHAPYSLPGPPSSHTPSALALWSTNPSSSEVRILQSSSQQPATAGAKGGRVGGAGGSGGSGGG
eukprot:5793098-Prymnesium_polylepis.1